MLPFHGCSKSYMSAFWLASVDRRYVHHARPTTRLQWLFKKENKSRYFPPLEWFLRAWKFRRVEPKHATARFVIPYQCAKHKFLFIVREVKKKGRRWRSSCWYIHLYIQYISSRDCWTGYLVLRGEGKKGSGSNPEIKAQPSPIGNLINTK